MSGWGAALAGGRFANRPYDRGGAESGECAGIPLRVPSGQALRQAQGERIWEARVRWGVGDAMGDGDAPRRAPLDSCLRRNDARGGVRVVMRGLLVAKGPLRVPSGASTGSGRTDLGSARAVGRGGCDGGRRRSRAALPSGFLPSQERRAWWSAGRRGLLVVEGPLRVPSGQALREALGERIWEARVRWGVGDAMGDGDAPRRAPLDSCLRRNDARGGVRGWGSAGAVGGGVRVPLSRDGPSRGSGRTGSRTAPTDSGGVRGSTTVAFGGRNCVWLSGLALV